MYHRLLPPLLAAVLGLSLPAHAQQDPQWSMYMFNRFVFNPAFAAHTDAGNFTFAGRSQWVGIDGHPESFSAAFSTPVYKLHGALGGYLLSDQIGRFATTSFKASYAYRIELGEESASALQIGVSAGGLYKTLDGTNWRPPQQAFDPTLPYGMVSQFSPDVGMGVAIITPDDRYYVGFSVDHLTQPKLSEFSHTSGSAVAKIDRSYTLTAGYTFPLDVGVSLKPSILIKKVGPITQVDLNANVRVEPMVFGVSYRLQDALVAIVGFQISSKLFTAYSYDYTLSKLAGGSSGSHEVLLSYTFPRVWRLFPPNFGVRDKPSTR